MAIELIDGVNGDGLFDVQGVGFAAIAALELSAGTTIPTAIEAYLEQFEARADSNDLEFGNVMAGLPDATSSWQTATAGLSATIARTAERLLIEAVNADDDRPTKSLADALEYLIDQMETAGDYVDATAITATAAAGGSNAGNVAIVTSTRRGDGKTAALAYAEVIDVTTTAAATLRLRGELAEKNPLSPLWPKGSGCDVSLAVTDASSSLVFNGDFETETVADTPDEWIITVGVPGTSIVVTAPCEQTVEIGGTPTAGTYVLQWENKRGETRATEHLAYNASASAVQTALRAIPGLEEVTVTATGTTPNFTHTVVFEGTGVHGSVSQLTSVSHLTGGTPTITHATTVVGQAGAYRGKALKIVGDGAELTEIYAPLTLLGETPYCCHFRAIRGPVRDGSSSSSAGAITGTLVVDVVQEIGGSALTDPAGNAQTLTVPLVGLSDVEHASQSFTFRLALTATMPCYLRFRLTEAISAGASIFVDDVAVVAMTELYAGGPWVAAFAGRNPPVPDVDEWTLTVTSDRGGAVQEWYGRCFAMAAKGLLLPTTGGGTNIPDTVIP